MPTYSYRCTECSTAFDIQQAFTDDSLTECPTCQGRLRKVFSSIGVTFNGSGFYRTDSRAGDRSNSSGSGSGSKDSGSKDSGSKDSSSTATSAKKESTSGSSSSGTSTTTAAAS
jgi:putative FmdB family regulatory protein